MIDLTLSSEDETPPKRRRAAAAAPQPLPATRPNTTATSPRQLPSQQPAVAQNPTAAGSLQALPAGASVARPPAHPPTHAAQQPTNPAPAPAPQHHIQRYAPPPALQSLFGDGDDEPSDDDGGAGGCAAAAAGGDLGVAGAAAGGAGAGAGAYGVGAGGGNAGGGDDGDAGGAWDFDAASPPGAAPRGRGGAAVAAAAGGYEDPDDPDWNGEEEDEDEGGGGRGGARKRSGAAARKQAAAGGGGGGGYGTAEEDAEAEAGEPKKRRGGGGGKRLTAEEREERERAKAGEKAAKAAERVRAREEKAAAKVAEKERKAAEKEEQKRSKAAAKDAVRAQKEADNALKCSQLGRHMRVLLSNCLAASPLGAAMEAQAPLVRGGVREQTFPHEVHRDMPLAAKGYRYCMWGARLPAPAAARLLAAEGCALEACGLGDPEGSGMPLLLFPLLLVALSGEELLRQLAAEGGAGPLGALCGEVRRAHPGCSAVLYVVGLEEALRRRERGNKAFSRAAVEDLLFDVAVGMPAVRLQYDCPESDLARAATDILNLGYSLSQQPRKRQGAYIDTFGSRSTAPLRAIKSELAARGGVEQVALCEALSCLVPPQRAAAVAAEHPSLGALLEAMRARPEGPARNNMLARCRIPGVEAGKHKQQYAGPAASASIMKFLQTQNGREEWKDMDD